MDERDSVLVSFYSELAAGDGDATLRLFVRGNSPAAAYAVLGKWATRIAQEYIKSSVVVKNWGTSANPLPAVGISEAASREIIQDALLHNSTAVEMYEKSAPCGWKLIRRGSPGYIGDFENALFGTDEVDVQVVCMAAVAVRIDPSDASNVRVGCAFGNMTLRRLFVCQFCDSLHLVHTSAALAQHAVKELLLPKSIEIDLPKVHESLSRVISRLGISTRFVSYKPTGPITADLERRLAALLSVKENVLEVAAMEDAAPALQMLLVNSGIADDPSNAQAFQIQQTHITSMLKLDGNALTALDLVAAGKESGKNKMPVSIYGWLNRCLTGMGSRMMRQWLLQPLRDEETLLNRQAMVEVMVGSPILRDSLKHNVFRYCLDLDRFNRKLQRNRASLKEILSLLSFINTLPVVVELLSQHTASTRFAKLVEDEYTAPLRDMATHTANLRVLVETTIEIPPGESDARIKPEFDDEMIELDTQRSSVLESISSEYTHAMRHYGWTDKQLKSEYHPTYGHVFRVSRKDDKQVRDCRELLTVNTAKDGVRFTTPKLSAANETFNNIQKQYDKRQRAIHEKLMETVASYLPVLDDAKEVIAQLDVYAAWATIVCESRHPMVRPTLLPSAQNIIRIQGLRHPLVEMRQSEYVANDVALSPAANGMIITGPNMGGKSTYMRSVGVAVVLAQAGCFVPAESAEISLRDAILCRVGATDYLSQGVSTFMVEMLESASILTAATSESLVIIDELGRGTSTYDGFGLAWAIAEQLSTVCRASVLFATHFHEMTFMCRQHPNLRNLHVSAEASEDRVLRFLYKVLPGPCARSFGIHVAELAKLPASVIEEARRKAEELECFDSSANDPLMEAASENAAVTRKLLEYSSKIAQLSEGDVAAAQQLQSQIRSDADISPLMRI